mgnify:CR=1 FL=1
MQPAELILPATDSITLVVQQGVLYLTLNRPVSRNAMTAAMLDEIIDAFDAIRGRLDVRAVVIRGAGGHFCAGADLKSLATAPKSAGDDPIAALNRRFGTMLQQVEAASQVVVVVCEGSVLGGGFGLACVSDVAFAQVDAKFAMPETT